MDVHERHLRWSRLAALLEPVHGPALATARRLSRTAADGDDLYADTVLRAFERLHTLRDESRFRPWFFATLLSRHRSRARIRFWRRFVPLDDAFPAGAGPAGADGSRWDDDALRARRVAAALGTLPAAQREAVVLFEVDGYRIEEVATLQGASVAAVKSRLARGREALRRWYQLHGTTAQREQAAGAERGAPIRDPDERSGNHFARFAAAACGPREETGPHE
jgi:RNA polymerase sigma-70 factor (ECF subfamily)